MGDYNPGNKGYIVLGLIVFFMLFVSLLVFVYQMNMEGLN